MNAVLRKILVVIVKNAVNAVLTNTMLMAMLPSVFHMHTKEGLLNLLKVAAGVVIGREGAVWLPELLRWSRTNAEPPNFIEPPKQ